MYTLVIPCGLQAIQPDHDSILQVFIIVAFDIKALVVQLHEATFQHGPRAIKKVKNVCAYSPCTCFVAADHWSLVFSMMWKSRQRYVQQLVYSVSVLLLLKYILVWRNIRYFMDNHRIKLESKPPRRHYC